MKNKNYYKKYNKKCLKRSILRDKDNNYQIKGN